MKKIFFGLCCISILIYACNGNKTPAPVRTFGDNTLYHNFYTDASGQSYLIRELSIVPLDSSKTNPLALLTALPVTHAFTQVVKTSKALILQTQDGLQFYDAKYTLASTYAAANKCDLLATSDSLLFVGQGGSVCSSTSYSPGIKVLNFNDLSKIKEVTLYATNAPVDMLALKRIVFLAMGSSGLSVIDFTTPNSPKVLSTISNTVANQLSIDTATKTLIVNNDTQVIQYDYSNLSQLKQISIIPVGK